MEPRCSKSMVLLFLPCGILLLSLPLLFHIHKKGQSNSQPELRGIYSTIEEINGNGIYLNGISLKSLILGLGLFSGTEREAMHHTVLHLLEMLPAVSQKILQQRHIWYSFQTGKCIPSSPALNTNALLLSIYINSAWMQMPGSGCSCGSAAVTPFFFLPALLSEHWKHTRSRDESCQLAPVPDGPSPLRGAGSRWHVKATQAEESFSLLWKHLSQQAVRCPAFRAGHRPAKTLLTAEQSHAASNGSVILCHHILKS